MEQLNKNKSELTSYELSNLNKLLKNYGSIEAISQNKDLILKYYGVDNGILIDLFKKDNNGMIVLKDGIIPRTFYDPSNKQFSQVKIEEIRRKITENAKKLTGNENVNGLVELSILIIKNIVTIIHTKEILYELRMMFELQNYFVFGKDEIGLLEEIDEKIKENGLNLDVFKFLKSYKDYIEGNLAGLQEEHKKKIKQAIKRKFLKLGSIIDERIKWVDEQIKEGDYKQQDRAQEIRNQRWIINAKLQELFEDINNKVLPSAMFYIKYKNITLSENEKKKYDVDDKIAEMENMFKSAITEDGDFDKTWTVRESLDAITNNWDIFDISGDDGEFMTKHGIQAVQVEDMLIDNDKEIERNAMKWYMGYVIVSMIPGIGLLNLNGLPSDAVDFFSDEEGVTWVLRKIGAIDENYRMEKTFLDTIFSIISIISQISIIGPNILKSIKFIKALKTLERMGIKISDIKDVALQIAKQNGVPTSSVDNFFGLLERNIEKWKKPIRSPFPKIEDDTIKAKKNGVSEEEVREFFDALYKKTGIKRKKNVANKQTLDIDSKTLEIERVQKRINDMAELDKRISDEFFNLDERYAQHLKLHEYYYKYDEFLKRLSADVLKDIEAGKYSDNARKYAEFIGDEDVKKIIDDIGKLNDKLTKEREFLAELEKKTDSVLDSGIKVDKLSALKQGRNTISSIEAELSESKKRLADLIARKKIEKEKADLEKALGVKDTNENEDAIREIEKRKSDLLRTWSDLGKQKKTETDNLNKLSKEKTGLLIDMYKQMFGKDIHRLLRDLGNGDIKVFGRTVKKDGSGFRLVEDGTYYLRQEDLEKKLFKHFAKSPNKVELLLQTEGSFVKARLGKIAGKEFEINGKKYIINEENDNRKVMEGQSGGGFKDININNLDVHTQEKIAEYVFGVKISSIVKATVDVLKNVKAQNLLTQSQKNSIIHKYGQKGYNTLEAFINKLINSLKNNLQSGKKTFSWLLFGGDNTITKKNGWLLFTSVAGTELWDSIHEKDYKLFSWSNAMDIVGTAFAIKMVGFLRFVIYNITWDLMKDKIPIDKLDDGLIKEILSSLIKDKEYITV